MRCSPRMMKENLAAARGCLMSYKPFGALTLHVNLIPATNSYPKLLPLSTHSKQGRVSLRRRWKLVSWQRIRASHLFSGAFRQVTPILKYGVGGILPLAPFFHSNLLSGLADAVKVCCVPVSVATRMSPSREGCEAGEMTYLKVAHQTAEGLQGTLCGSLRMTT